ncbi:hypothetical protein JF714_15730 [Mycobacterium avium]|uniref:hypothetical protein n=1 Tax=Mycobacterium avium TaxID=1764 RepID=UPI001CDAF464|nr:hypothetical protein [Mycobacterium avium]MCA2331893.1 hypothetical protein [Mycobacterium avium]
MRFGEKFASLRFFTAECVDSVGEGYVLDHSKDEFLCGITKHPEAIVAFDHTIQQSMHRDFLRDGFLVRTQAIVLRAQLALEGPKEG